MTAKNFCFIVISLIIFSVIVLCLGCGGGSYLFPEPEKNPSAGSYVSKSGIFKTYSGEYPADFGTISVSENRQDSSSRIIHLPVIRIHSGLENPLEPIFYLSGGPGTSNMKWIPPDTLLADHDFVMVGYRGVDGSVVLDCPEVAEAMKTDDDLLSESSLKRMADAWNTSAQRLQKTGIDLNGYTIPEVIEDNETVRKVLGYKQIDLLSESYGTRIAYFYGVNYPESICRSVMIGVNPPGHFVWNPQTTDSLLNYYNWLWSKDSVMSLKAAYISETMRQVLNNMPRKWLFFSLNPGKIKVITLALLFHRNTAAMVFDTYVAAEQGDPSGLALMSFAFDYIMPSMMIWGDLASKAISADYDSTRDYINEMMPANCILGSPLCELLWGPLRYMKWPVQPIPERYRKLQRSDVETLLLSGNVDFSTSVQDATNELLPYLPNGRQIVLSECGHVGDVWGLNWNATQKMLASFYSTGIPDTSLNKYIPMNFEVGWGFPRIAKATLGIVTFLLAAIVVGIVVWII